MTARSSFRNLSWPRSWPISIMTGGSPGRKSIPQSGSWRGGEVATNRERDRFVIYYILGTFFGRTGSEVGSSPMISQRQIDFRNEYRSRIVGWYNGYFHIVLIYMMGAAVLYVYVSHIHNVTWLEWLTVPLTFIFTNVFEWAVHKFVMHRPVNIKGLRAVYERHTLNHHQFFSDDEMRFRDDKDWRVTVFPPYALVMFTLMS